MQIHSMPCARSRFCAFSRPFVIGAASALLFAARALAGEAHVSVDNFTFTPATLTVSAGTTVVFQNNDDIPHQVVASDNAYRSKALDTGDAFRYSFGKLGRFSYFCGLHPHMTGTIVVTN